MTIWIVVLLALVQGVTEFLPLSSSGHLILLEYVFGVENCDLTFNIFLHAGTLFATCVGFSNEIVKIIKNPIQKTTWHLCLATLATVGFAVLCSRIDGVFEGKFLGVCFILTGIILIVNHILSKNNRLSMTSGRAFLVGVVQGFAVLPGLSRSGTTIASARLSGIEKQEATNFSFLVSVPTTLGGMVKQIFSNNAKSDLSMIGGWNCFIGFMVAFIVGLCSIWLVKKFTINQKWWVFSPYLLLLGISVLIFQYAV